MKKAPRRLVSTKLPINPLSFGETRSDKTIFTFTLTAREAQNIYDLFECMKEEPVFREIWDAHKKRREVLRATRRYAKQLNQQYTSTGVEV